MGGLTAAEIVSTASSSLASSSLSSSEPSQSTENRAVVLDCDSANELVSGAVDAVELQREGATVVAFTAAETSVLSESVVMTMMVTLSVG